jgi:[protein-PII] uridylyltransferase
MTRSRFDNVENRRTLVDRRGIADALAAIPSGRDRHGYAIKILRGALEQGRAEIARRLSLEPDRGRAAARATAYLHDQVVRLAYDFTTNSLGGDQPPQPMAIVGIGGTGRGEMAPFSDVDLMFLTRTKPAKEQERAVEAVLPLLWDLKLKVGPAGAGG